MGLGIGNRRTDPTPAKVGGVDKTGYTTGQKKALKTAKSMSALNAVDKRRKAMAEIIGE